MKKEMRIELQVIGILIVLIIGGKLILWPLLGDIHFRKGLRAVSEIEYEEAVTEFKIALNYKNEAAYFENLAGVYRTMGMSTKNAKNRRKFYEQSVYYYKKLLNLKPKSALALNGIGATCLYMGKDLKDEKFFRSAIENFQKAIEFEPRLVESHTNLATAYYLWGLKEKALETYEKARKVNPDSTTIIFNLGMLYYLEKDFDRAEAEWQGVLKIDPDNLDAGKGLEMLRDKK
ncbi:MAG: tetratricopeptide repeat protein [bacterium]